MKKRIIMLCVALVMAFSAASCTGGLNNGDNAQRFTNAVAEIGAVDGSQASKDRILNAVALFNKLKPSERSRAEASLQVLEQKVGEYFQLTGELLFTRPGEPNNKPNYAELFMGAVMEIGAVDGSQASKNRILNAVALFYQMSTDDWIRVEYALQLLEQKADDYYKLTGELLFTRPGEPGEPEEPDPEPDPDGGYNPVIDPDDCTFYDDFSGDALDAAKWGYDEGGDGFGNQEVQYYQKENAVVSDGTLKLVAKLERRGNRDHTSAKVSTQGKFSQTYGRFEARVRLTTAHTGFWPAFWMMPQSPSYGGWPHSGEIDIVEWRGREYYKASSALHNSRPPGHTGDSSSWTSYYNNTEPSDRNFNPDFNITDYHIYSCDWQPGRMSFFIDGKLTYSVRWNGQVTPGSSSAGTLENLGFSPESRNPSATMNQWSQNGRAWQANAHGASGVTATEADPRPFNRPFYMILNFAIGGKFDNHQIPPDSAFMAGNPELEADPCLQIDFVRVFDLDYMLANPHKPAAGAA